MLSLCSLTLPFPRPFPSPPRPSLCLSSPPRFWSSMHGSHPSRHRLKALGGTNSLSWGSLPTWRLFPPSSSAVLRLWWVLIGTTSTWIRKVFCKSFLSHAVFFAGFSGHICSVCRGEPRQRVDCWEGFHFHRAVQHSSISPGHAANAHRCYCASKGTTTNGARTQTRPERPLTCCLAFRRQCRGTAWRSFWEGKTLKVTLCAMTQVSVSSPSLFPSVPPWSSGPYFICACTAHNVFSVHLLSLVCASVSIC